MNSSLADPVAVAWWCASGLACLNHPPILTMFSEHALVFPSGSGVLHSEQYQQILQWIIVCLDWSLWVVVVPLWSHACPSTCPPYPCRLPSAAFPSEPGFLSYQTESTHIAVDSSWNGLVVARWWYMSGLACLPFTCTLWPIWPPYLAFSSGSGATLSQEHQPIIQWIIFSWNGHYGFVMCSCDVFTTPPAAHLAPPPASFSLSPGDTSLPYKHQEWLYD